MSSCCAWFNRWLHPSSGSMHERQAVSRKSSNHYQTFAQHTEVGLTHIGTPLVSSGAPPSSGSTQEEVDEGIVTVFQYFKNLDSLQLLQCTSRDATKGNLVATFTRVGATQKTSFTRELQTEGQIRYSQGSFSLHYKGKRTNSARTLKMSVSLVRRDRRTDSFQSVYRIEDVFVHSLQKTHFVLSGSATSSEGSFLVLRTILKK